jgi:hypothetical protein
MLFIERGIGTMLKITPDMKKSSSHLPVEDRLVGPWARELEQSR